MEGRIRLLFIGKSANCYERVIKSFRKEEVPASYHQARTRAAVKEALNAQPWDLIVADSHTLSLMKLSIAEIFQQHCMACPLIMIGTDISEEAAVKAMSEGACHCLDKKRLQCLPLIAKNELNHTKPSSIHCLPLDKLSGLMAVIQHNPDEIYLFEAESLQYTFANTKALDNLNYTMKEFTDLRFPQLYPDHTVTSARQLIAPLLNRNQSKVSVCTWQKRKNGTPYPVELHLLRTDSDSGLLAASCSDLSHRREEIKTHNQQKKRAERCARLSKQQGKLAANVNHDLRTGLNSISLLSKALNKQESGLNDKQQAYVDNIYHTNIDLLELVDEALALARIQPAKTALSFKEINIQKVCQRLESLFSPIARENSLSFSYNTSDECPETVTTNALCLQRILKNLLSNAFKFTEEGSVTLNIYSPADTESGRPGIDGNNNIAFQIQDTGIGIPEEKQNLIFQRFQQAETSVREGYRGIGLGLAICQDLTQQLGGTLQVQSTRGQGSTFTLYLPQKKAASDMQNAKAAKKKKGRKDYSTDGTVLLVDDCQMHSMALKEFLSYKIPHCISVTSADETYRVLEKNQIDCLVLDMSLRNSNSHEIMTYLKTHEEYESIPIIIYTGKKLSGDDKEKLSQYAHSIINKSAGSYEVLQSKILSILADY